MVWGIIRIAIFFGAFALGLIFVDQFMPSVASNSLRKHSATSLLVVCKSGNMLVRHVSDKPDTVQLECVYSKTPVVRDQKRAHPDSSGASNSRIRPRKPSLQL